MVRDARLETWLRDHLGARPGIAEKPMFGGLAFLLNGNLLCAARQGSLLLRLGRGEDDWALAVPGVVRTEMRGREMPGWVHAQAKALADPALTQRLLDRALSFVEKLPPKRQVA